MSSIHKKIEIVGTSPESFTTAAGNAVAKASESLHNLQWFEVTEMRGRVKEGKIDEYQVSLKVGFRLD